MSRLSVTRLGALLVGCVLLIGAAGIYATRPRVGNGAQQGTGVPAGANPLAAFVRKVAPEPLPNVAFQNAEGQAVTLESFRGRVVLLNLWATWCLPCRKEMPALDRLQTALGSDTFEVVALSIDRSGVAGARKFLDSVGISKLKLYADPTAKLANEFKAIGLPTTLLIDRGGREIGRLIGPAEWDDADAQRLIKAALAAQ